MESIKDTTAESNRKERRLLKKERGIWLKGTSVPYVKKLVEITR